MPTYNVHYKLPEIGIHGYVIVEAEDGVSASITAKREFEMFACQWVRGLAPQEVLWDNPALMASTGGEQELSGAYTVN